MIQLKIILAVALGFFVLLPATLFHMWTGPTFPSIKPCPDGSATIGGYGCVTGPARRYVDEWSLEILNKWYGNSEDGVSGKYAYIWDANNNLVPYYSTFPSWMPQWAMAYAWSAWRNNANNLKRPLRGDSLTGQVP